MLLLAHDLGARKDHEREEVTLQLLLVLVEPLVRNLRESRLQERREPRARLVREKLVGRLLRRPEKSAFSVEIISDLPNRRGRGR